MKGILLKALKTLLLGCMMLSSCALEHPRWTFVPLLEEEGDVCVEVAAACSVPSIDCPSLNFSAAWAPLNHFGVQASVSSVLWKPTYAKIGAGSFLKLGNNQVAELYVGVGTGDGSYENGEDFRMDGSYTKLYAQLDMGCLRLFKNCADLAFGLRTDWFFPHWTQYNYDDYLGREVASPYHDDSFLFVDPFVMLRVGGRTYEIHHAGVLCGNRQLACE